MRRCNLSPKGEMTKEKLTNIPYFFLAPSSIFFIKITKRAESANGIMKNVEIID